MSDILPLLFSEAHKPEFTADAHALAYGGGTPARDIGHLNPAAEPSSDTAQFPGGLRSDAASQIDSLHAQSPTIEQITALMATTALSPGAEPVPSGTSPDTASFTRSGTAVASLPGITPSHAAGSATPVEAATGLPKMQFISDDNALLTNSHPNETNTNSIFSSAGAVQNGRTDGQTANDYFAKSHSVEPEIAPVSKNIIHDDAVNNTSQDNNPSKGHDATSPRLAISLRSQGMIMTNGTEVPSETINVEGHAPSGAIGAGGGGGGASGGHDGGGGMGNTSHQAGEVYTVRGLSVRYIGNIGYVLADNGKDFATYKSGPESWSPLPVDLLQQKVDQIAKETTGSAASEQALRDARHISQSENFGSKAYDDSLRRAIAQSSQTHDALSRVINNVQNRSVDPGDETWIRAKQDSIARGETTVGDAQRELAKWSAEHGQYDQQFRDVHNRDPNSQDRVYAGNMIGNGWSVQDYRWNEAHSEGATREYQKMFQDVTGTDASDADIRWIKDTIGNGSTAARVRGDLAHSSSGSNAIQKSYLDYGNITPSLDTIHSWQDSLARGGTVAGMSDAIINAHGADAIRRAYHDAGGIEPGAQQVADFVAHLRRGGTVESVRQLVIDVHGADAIRKAYHDAGGIEPGAQQVADFVAHLHRGGTVESVRQMVINVHGADAIRSAYHGAGGIEPGAQQVADFLDYLRRGGTIQGVRGLVAEVHGGETASRYANSILGHDLSPEQRAQYVDRLTRGATLNDVVNDIAHGSEAQRYVQDFISRNFGSDHDGLSASATNAIINLAIGSNTLVGMTIDSIQKLGQQLSIEPSSGNVLDYLLPKNPSDWVKLAAASAAFAVTAGLLVTPAGEVLVAADLVLLGGAAQLGLAGMILESRFVTELATGKNASGGTTRIVDDAGKEHAIDFIAEKNAPHAEKHIVETKFPDLGLEKVGIKNVQDITRYLKETLSQAPYDTQRYEIRADLDRDLLAIWDRENKQVTIFQPKPSANDGNMGTTFRPQRGYDYFLGLRQ